MLAPRATLDGLAKAGFKTNLGPHGSGLLQLLWSRAGGYYFGTSLDGRVGSRTAHMSFGTDVGTSKHIIDGDVKVKNGSAIARFTENGLAFADGTTLEADVVIFATG